MKIVTPREGRLLKGTAIHPLSSGPVPLVDRFLDSAGGFLVPDNAILHTAVLEIIDQLVIGFETD